MTRADFRIRLLAFFTVMACLFVLFKIGCYFQREPATKLLSADTAFRAQLARVAKQAVAIHDGEYKNQKKTDSVLEYVEKLAMNNNLLLDSIQKLNRLLHDLPPRDLPEKSADYVEPPVIPERVEVFTDTTETQDSLKAIAQSELTNLFNYQFRQAIKNSDSLTHRTQVLTRRVKWQRVALIIAVVTAILVKVSK